MISEVVAEEHQVMAPLENIKFEDEIVAIGESTLVSLPTESSPQLNLESLDEEKSLAIGLPQTVDVGTAQTSADGTVVHYEGSEETNYGLITHDTGTSILLSIESGASAEAYPFELSAAEEMELDLLDDGAVEISLGGEAATRVTVAITKALSKAKTGTSLHKVDQAWKALGELDGAPLKILLGVIKSYFVTLGKNIGRGSKSAAVAARKEISKGKMTRVLSGIAFSGAMDLISDVTGLTGCRSVVTGE